MDKKYYYLIAGVLVLLVAIFSIKGCNKAKDKTEEILKVLEDSQDTMITVINEDSSSTSIIKVIETSDVDDFVDLPINDSTIIALQEKVKHYKDELDKLRSVTTLSTITKWRTKVKTETIYLTQIDTIFIPGSDRVVYKEKFSVDSIFLTPTYKSTFDLDGWVQGSVVSNEDSTEVNAFVKDDFTITIGNEKDGFFGESVPYAFVTSLNPYSRTKNFKTYSVKEDKRSRWGFGPFIGVGLSSADNFSKLGLVGGIGVTYEMIGF